MRKLLPSLFAVIFLSACGTTGPANVSTLNKPVPNDKARVVITRNNSMMYLAATVHIRANGEKIASLGRGGSVVHEVPQGRNTLSVSTPTAPGQFSLTFNADPQKTYNFEISPRYGNVMGSRGSVIPFFLDQRAKGVLPITDPRMTRFNISLQEGVDMVLYALQYALGGEILVPKIPSYRITDVAEAVGPNCEMPIVGIRPGEKLHEEMVTASDSRCTIENDQYYVIVPMSWGKNFEQNLARYADYHKATSVEPDFRYSSDKNDRWLSVDQLRELIRTHVDSSFEVA